MIAKLQAVHAVVANAPKIIAALASDAQAVSRFFYGTGAPAAATLLAGNGKYNAALSGWVIAATLQSAGSGHAVGDTLTVGTAIITVDAVIAGTIVDFHVSAYGNYSAGSYPANPVATTATSGSGTGATFNFTWPAPDFYIDMTSPTSPVLYICTTAGSATTSVWAKISGAGSGGGTYAGTYVNANAYSVGQIVRVQSTTTVGGVTPTLGVFGCVAAVPALGSGNQVPQYPEPTSGTVYWHLLAFGPQETGECNGSSGNLYVNASAPF